MKLASANPACHSKPKSHGGAGTTLAAAAAGLPLLLMPHGADQYVFNELVVRAGAALCMPPPEVNARNVRKAVTALLDEPACRAAATSLQAEIAVMPPPEAVIADIEAIVESARAYGRSLEIKSCLPIA